MKRLLSGKILKIAILSAVLLILVYLVYTAICIVNYGRKDDKTKTDVAIVLGAGTTESYVSPVYRERINHAVNLYKEGYVDYIILTGGVSKGREHSDAYIAKSYALTQSVPEEVILIEERSTITEENLENAKVAYNKLVARIAQLRAEEGESVDSTAYEEGRAKFRAALDNDLNTSLAVTALYDVLKMETGDATKLALVRDFERVLDIGLIANAQKLNEEKKQGENGGVDPELLAYINKKTEERREAKKNKNFAEADAIRAELLQKGITLLDTREGTKFQIEQ